MAIMAVRWRWQTSRKGWRDIEERVRQPGPLLCLDINTLGITKCEETFGVNIAHSSEEWVSLGEIQSQRKRILPLSSSPFLFHYSECIQLPALCGLPSERFDTGAARVGAIGDPLLSSMQSFLVDFE